MNPAGGTAATSRKRPIGPAGPCVPNELIWRPDLTSRRVDEQRIVDIAFTPMEPRLRNELITLAYGDLAQQMSRLLGTTDTTWAGFGLWASNTVGGFLALPIPGLGRVIARSFGDGNRDVFANIGRAHTTFLATVGEAYLNGGHLGNAWQDCEALLRRRLVAPAGDPLGLDASDDDEGPDPYWLEPFDPRLEPAGPQHNRLLVMGFRAYYHAITAVDPDERSRQILVGNCMLALHEQKLLSLAISTGFRTWVRTVTTFWRFFENRVSWGRRSPGRLRLRLERAWIHFATKRLVGVGLPHGKISSGKPVPAGPRPIVLDDAEGLLGDLVEAFDVDGRAAVCWNDLADRMAYIIALFAQHQRSPFWLDDFDRPVRPKTWPRFERKLAATMRRYDEARIPASSSGATDCPLTSAELDDLRMRPTHLPVPVPSATSLSDAVEAEHGSGFDSVRDDVARRHATVIAENGLLSASTCASARATFQRFPSMWFMALLVRSLPDDYGAAIGVHGLGRISSLASESFRRAGETAHFVHDLLASDQGWDNGRLVADGGAYQSIQGVRTLHAMVAEWLIGDDWPAAYGLAMNQEDMLGTALSFAVSTIEVIDSIDDRLLSTDERDEFVRFWLGIGHLLGVDLEIATAPKNYAQAHALANTIWARHRARTVDGVRLSEALAEGVADGFPRPFHWLAPGLMQAFGDPAVTTSLMIGGGIGRRRAAFVAAGTRFMFRNRVTRPVAQWMVRRIGSAWVMPFLEQGRTRPYRRPATPSDESRIALASRRAELWPTGCQLTAAQQEPLDRGHEPGVTR